MSQPESPLLPHGGYRKLRSYVIAEAVYDATVVFCRRFFAHDRRMTELIYKLYQQSGALIFIWQTGI